MKLTAESTVVNDNKLNTDITTAQDTADTAVSKADNAQTTANQAKNVADNTAQYFWFKSEGTDTGAHISEKTQAEFEASPSGGNLLARSNGMAVRDGLTELATFTKEGASFVGDNGSVAQMGISSTPQNILIVDDTPSASTSPVTYPDLANAVNGTVIEVLVELTYIPDVGDSYVYGHEAFAFTKGTADSSDWRLTYDGNYTFEHDFGTDYVSRIVRVTYYKSGIVPYLRIGNTGDTTNAIVVGTLLNSKAQEPLALDWSGNLTIAGNLQSANVGDTNAGGTNGVSGSYGYGGTLNSGVWQDIARMDLKKGVYIVIATITFEANTAGIRSANVTDTASQGWHFISNLATANNRLMLTQVVNNATDGKSYYINAYQNSGRALTIANVEYYYVRIK